MLDTPFKVIGVANWPEYIKTLPIEQRDWKEIVHDVIREMRNDYPVVTDAWLKELHQRVLDVTTIIIDQDNNFTHKGGIWIGPTYDRNKNILVGWVSFVGEGAFRYEFETDTFIMY